MQPSSASSNLKLNSSAGLPSEASAAPCSINPYYRLPGRGGLQIQRRTPTIYIDEFLVNVSLDLVDLLYTSVMSVICYNNFYSKYFVTNPNSLAMIALLRKQCSFSSVKATLKERKNFFDRTSTLYSFTISLFSHTFLSTSMYIVWEYCQIYHFSS